MSKDDFKEAIRRADKYTQRTGEQMFVVLEKDEVGKSHYELATYNDLDTWFTGLPANDIKYSTGEWYGS